MKKRRGGSNNDTAGVAGVAGAAGVAVGATGGILAQLGMFGTIISYIIAGVSTLYGILMSLSIGMYIAAFGVFFYGLYLAIVQALKITNIVTWVLNTFVGPVINFFLGLIKMLTGKKGKSPKIKIPQVLESPIAIIIAAFSAMVSDGQNSQEEEEEEEEINFMDDYID
jgi:hypothetical protein